VLREGEPVYISTDHSPSWFGVIEQHGHATHFYKTTGKKALHDMRVSPKISGMVEAFVCSLARVFVGTPLSTFTGVIHQMRAFNDRVANKTQFWHVKT
jgi:hypothetical protein